MPHNAINLIKQRLAWHDHFHSLDAGFGITKPTQKFSSETQGGPGSIAHWSVSGCDLSSTGLTGSPSGAGMASLRGWD